MSARERPVPERDAGERLDRWLARELDQPRHQIQRWIADGRVTVDGRAAKPSTALRAGAAVRWTPPAEPVAAGLVAESGELAVLYEDDDLVAVDKAAGVAVHPGAGRDRGTLVHFLLDRYPEIVEVGGPGRPGIVHRLDLDTTGVLVVARSRLAYRALVADFAARRIEKTYLAIVYGEPKRAAGTVELPIGRHRQRRKEMQVRADGRPARTGYRVRDAGDGIALLELDLHTGRTHQIRVHMKAIGHPLVGDPVYGEARWRGLPRAVRAPLAGFERPALHAWRLRFAHPRSGEPLALEAPVPADLRRLWQAVTGRAWRDRSGPAAHRRAD